MAKLSIEIDGKDESVVIRNERPRRSNTPACSNLETPLIISSELRFRKSAVVLTNFSFSAEIGAVADKT